MTIAVPECSSETWRRNSTPSMPGMSRSQTTMSGRGSAPSSASAPSPSAASSSLPAPRLARICSVVRRWNYVIAGTATREEAAELAARLHGEVEPGGELVWEARPSNPFAVFGGMGS